MRGRWNSRGTITKYKRYETGRQQRECGSCCECSEHLEEQNRIELEKYAEGVRRRIQENLPGVFNNMSPAHASVIVEAFLEAAQNNIRILCHRLAADVYGRITDVFRRILAEDKVRVQVVTNAEYEELESQDLAQMLRAKGSLHCGYNRDLPHFIISDGCRYRLETDESLRTAVVCASTVNDKKRTVVAKVINDKFDDVWQHSEAPKD